MQTQIANVTEMTQKNAVALQSLVDANLRFAQSISVVQCTWQVM